MGLESYVLHLEFKSAVAGLDVDMALIQLGFVKIKETGERLMEPRERFYEYTSTQGITEMHLHLRKAQVETRGVTMRFSVMNPPTVVKQSFDLIERLDARYPLKIQDPQIAGSIWRRMKKEGRIADEEENFPTELANEVQAMTYIPVDANTFSRNMYRLPKRTAVLLAHASKRPVQGGAATFALWESGDKSLIAQLFTDVISEMGEEPGNRQSD